MYVRERNIIAVLLLSFFTCGIYYLYLIYALGNDINEMTRSDSNSPMIDVLLSIVTCGIYTVYWYYKIARQIENMEYDRGMRVSNLAVLCCLLPIFGVGIVSMMIVQNELNKVIREVAY